MKHKSTIGMTALAALCGVLTGCVGYVDGGGYPASRSGYSRGGVVTQDDYVYYPSQQVYYSSNRRQYTYQNGGSWVTQSSPPRGSASVLRSSPSVAMNFHDSPQGHHASVAKQYPKQWSGNAKTAKSGKNNHNNTQPVLR